MVIADHRALAFYTSMAADKTTRPASPFILYFIVICIVVLEIFFTKAVLVVLIIALV